MDTTGLVFVTLTLNGILLVSPEPVSLEECQALRDVQATTLCIDKEPNCGKASGDEPCLGQAWWEERDKSSKPPAKKKKPVKKRARRAALDVNRLISGQ